MAANNQGDQVTDRERDSQGQFTGERQGSQSGQGRQGQGSQGQGGQGGRQGQGKSGGSDSRQDAARKGGEALSEDREHMAEIGRKGGQN
jgi:hypothetical protein